MIGFAPTMPRTTATLLVLALASLSASAAAQDSAPQSTILIKNVRVFDGVSDRLSAPCSLTAT